MLTQRSLQPPPPAGLRVAGGHVVSALPRHFESRLFEGGDDIGAAPHDAVLDALRQVVPDDLARVRFLLQAGPQVRRLDVGAVSGLLRSRPRRVVRPAPAVLVVEGVAQRVEGLLPAGRRDVEALARLQVAPGREDVHVDAPAVLAEEVRAERKRETRRKIVIGAIVGGAQMSETEISLGWLEAQIHALKRPNDRALFGLDPEANADATDADTTEPAGTPITSRQKKLLAQLVEEHPQLVRELGVNPEKPWLEALDKEKASFLIQAVLERVNPEAAAEQE